MGYKAEKGKLVINPEEAEVVRFIFAERQAGNTMLGIVDKLNKSNFKSRSGRPFALSSVQRILNNENTYRGLYRYGGKDSEWIKGEQEPILDPAPEDL